ncbi:MAG: metallophosphoesterase [Mariprofundaceae bacterium]|nr:metallophosphoesterase [Mariprofundaceae bacterium]
MKIQLLSDLHIEFEHFYYESTNADVIVLAGDIHIKDKGIRWALDQIKDKPVLYVLGNHEFYGKAYPKHIESLKELAEQSNVHVLENKGMTIDGVNFFGCTLWTDFQLYGDARLTGYECQQIMNDYKKIRLSPQYRKLRSIDTSNIHRHSLHSLQAELAAKAGEKNIVISHHGPSERSLASTAKGEVVSAAYVSSLEDTIYTYQPTYWLHGHMHCSSDYQVGGCRVLCNPKGYPHQPNQAFNAGFCFDV